MSSQGFFNRVWHIVAHIPNGRVVSYGQIAALLGNPRAARTVGWALHSTPDKLDIPWHRVVNSAGRVSTGGGEHHSLQRQLLEQEGVVFDARGYIDMRHYQWQPTIEVMDSIFVEIQ